MVLTNTQVDFLLDEGLVLLNTQIISLSEGCTQNGGFTAADFLYTTD